MRGANEIRGQLHIFCNLNVLHAGFHAEIEMGVDNSASVVGQLAKVRESLLESWRTRVWIESTRRGRQRLGVCYDKKKWVGDGWMSLGMG